jgi:hypothetical protein
MIIKDSVPNSDAYAAYTYRVKGINERNKIGDYEMDHDDPYMTEDHLYASGHFSQRDL